MTAEIAIVNRSAVTLAADSAMTLSVGGRRKVYTSTDKIFQLSERDPIGLMIYNNLEFMGAPIDVLVRHFRGSRYCCGFDLVSNAALGFFDYLSSEWQPSDEVQKRHVMQIISPHYRAVRRRFELFVRDGIDQNRLKKGSLLPLLVEMVEERVAELEQEPVSTCFNGTSENDLIDLYKDILDSVIGSVFRNPPLNDDQRLICRRLGALALHRDVFSDMLSGFVFAGFGNNEIFPSLIAYHTDGIIAGKLKTRLTEEAYTSREQVSAKIVPFAQREVVDRFLEGIDPQVATGISEYFDAALDEATSRLFDGVSRVGPAQKKKILENLTGTLGLAIADFEPDWLSKVKQTYAKETEDMVLFMAKQELAHLAESLVNITSLKRKYSAEEESVAGPIDVAVISKSDGFIWVKRKHYFPQELNHRYFVNKLGYNTPLQGGQNATQTP